MPIYEYQCEKCHEVFELLQSMHDAPAQKCPRCSGKARRIISSPAILFKGSGFHVTDYRPKTSSGKSAAPESPQKPRAPSEKSEKKKPDSSSPPKPKA